MGNCVSCDVKYDEEVLPPVRCEVTPFVLKTPFEEMLEDIQVEMLGRVDTPIVRVGRPV